MLFCCFYSIYVIKWTQVQRRRGPLAAGMEERNMEQRENQRVMLSKRLIKESLTRLLATESIHKLSVRALCEDAGLNRSTFYKYYGSPYDVLAEMEEELLDNVRCALGAEDAATDREKIESLCAYFERYMPSVRVLVGNNVDPAFPERLFNLPQVRQMILERLGNRCDAEERRYVYVFLVSGVYRLVQEWVLSDSSKSFREVAFLISDLIDRLCRDTDGDSLNNA